MLHSSSGVMSPQVQARNQQLSGSAVVCNIESILFLVPCRALLLVNSCWAYLGLGYKK